MFSSTLDRRVGQKSHSDRSRNVQTSLLSLQTLTQSLLGQTDVLIFALLSLTETPMQVIIYQGGQVFSLANHLNGRVGFVATMPSTSASIFINNTQLSDTGTYQCLVNNFPDRGGRNIGVIGLTVLGRCIYLCSLESVADV